MVKLGLILPPQPDERWRLAKQMGVDHAVIHPLEVGDGTQFWTFEQLRTVQNWLQDSGLSLSVIEGSVPLTDKTRMALDGRDEEIEQFKDFLEYCGTLGIDTICYDWIPGRHWARTAVHTPGRGGSLVTGFDERDMLETDFDMPDVSSSDLWANLEYFLGEVLPVAERKDIRLALHPDDPPLESVAGTPRIITSVDAYRRVMDLYDSPSNGITFCQGNFAAMGVDIPETIRAFGDDIHFVHFRDVEGTASEFVETWHDDGPTNMVAAMQAYHDIGFDGVMRPDHVPTMVGEANANPGYETKGRLFGIGYMRGLLQAAQEEPN